MEIFSVSIDWGTRYFCFYITLHWRGALYVCVYGEPKTFRSQSNKFFSSTEVSVLDGKRYKSTKCKHRCGGALGLPAERKTFPTSSCEQHSVASMDLGVCDR